MWWSIVVLLVLIFFATRTWNLTQAPPGLTHDEASNGHDSAAILQGIHRIYFPVGYGHEPLYNYSVALVTHFLGQGIFTLRITTVFWSLAQCILAAALARRWWGRKTALAVLAAYTVNFWSLMSSRVGLRAPVLPALFIATILAYDHAITSPARRAWRTYIIGGLCLGASFYTYMASRGLPLAFLLFLLGKSYDTIRKPALGRAGIAATDRVPRTEKRLGMLWLGTLGMLALALLVGAPLFTHLYANPELEQRISQLGHAVTALRAGDWRPLWINIRASAPLLLWQGDPYWLYNIAGRPGLEPVLAIAFIIGLVHALTRLRQRQYLLLLLWLAGGIAPALIAPVAYNLLHAIAAMPATLLLAGHGIMVALSALPPRSRATLAALSSLLLVLTGGETLYAYFVTWADHPDVRVAYHHHLVALGRHLETHNDGIPLVITSLYPGEFHDAYTMEVTLGRKDPALRWAGAGRALFVPDRAAQLYVEPQSHPDPILWNIIKPDLATDSGLVFRTDDLVSHIDAYTWNAPATWTRLSAVLTTELFVLAGDPAPQALAARPAADSASELPVITTAPVNFGDVVRLEGYTIALAGANSQAPESANTITLLTAWQVLASTEQDWIIFAHILDEEGAIVAQEDRLDAPAWQWQPGDRFIQLHHIGSSEDLAPGIYAVGLGLYSPSSMNRLPIAKGSSDTQMPATRVLLSLEELLP